MKAHAVSRTRFYQVYSAFYVCSYKPEWVPERVIIVALCRKMDHKIILRNQYINEP